MTRLYLRIFFSFWLVIIMTIAVVILINNHLDRAQRDATELGERALRTAEGMSARAQRALDRGGRSELARWAEAGPQRGRRLIVFVFDQSGQDLLERRPPRDVRALAASWLGDGMIPDPQRRGQFATTLSHPRHGDFLVVLSPPPRPTVLRIFGPLGLWGLAAMAILVSGLVCLWLARHITRPIQQLRLAGQALGRGDLSSRAASSASQRGDELGDLARDFNRMAERLQKLINAQRQLLRDVSHELRSPLARLQVSLTLAADSQGERQTAYLGRIEAEIERLDHLIGQILSYARLSEDTTPAFEPVDLMDLIEDIAESARLEGAPKQVAVTVDGPDHWTVPANAELLHRAIENVVRNALRHTAPGSTIALEVIPESERVTIAIHDQGPGIPEDRLQDVFEPFVRLSPERGESGAGGGVGLAIARAAVKHHQGDIKAANRRDGGLVVTITLPVT